MISKTEFILALALSLATTGAFAKGNPAAAAPKAAPMTSQQYEAEQQKLEAQRKADQRYCEGLKATKNARKLCEVQAKGKADSLKAELAARYKPSPEASLQAKTVTAEANFAVAKARCQDQKGKARDKCVDLAKAAREAAVRQARVEKVDETGGIFRHGAGTKGKDAKGVS